MATLTYKTRGNMSPQGKPKVYFCCHPDEATRFLHPVSDELLQKHNCAVWYLKDPRTTRTAELLNDLNGMQLFVIPVTRALLTTPNPAMDIEFPYAIRHHIPVLPLMQEEDLDESFNRRFGNLQYLSRFVDDPTAVPYDEKLTAYLSAVLIGDELAEQIRAAFDAYVFLSYRKCDRQYAQELMRLIHSHEFARDIAIWYDEYLTPGERFTDAIRKALRDSKLFVMAVTPHVIDPDNYVMTTEYPLARKEGKPILPAQMCPIDRAALERAFTDLPACTDARDDAALSDALLSALQEVACRENNTPMHDFFIGLAYLGGVDVEVDHDRALALITSAAERGLPQAIDKLVDMYQNGIGVERDYRTAIDWMIKKAAVVETQYRKADTEENARQLIWCYFHCGDAFKDIGELENAKQYYQKGIEFALQYMAPQKRGFFRRTVKERDSTFILSDLAAGYGNLGDIFESQGDLDTAELYYRKDLELCDALENKTDDTALRRRRMSCYMDLCSVAKMRDDLDGADNYGQQALELALAIAKDDNTAKARLNLSDIYQIIGTIAMHKHDYGRADQYLQKNLKLASALVEETVSIEARENLAVCYDRCGEFAEDHDNLKNAWKYYQKGLALTLALAEETGTIHARRNLSVSYHRLGVVARDRGNPDEARGFFRKSLALRQTIADETDTPESLDDLATSHYYLSTVTRTPDSTKHLQEALRLFTLLCERCPQVTQYRERRDFVQENWDDLR